MFHTSVGLNFLSLVAAWLAVLIGAAVWFVQAVGLYRSIAIAFVVIAALFSIALVRELRMRGEEKKQQ